MRTDLPTLSLKARCPVRVKISSNPRTVRRKIASKVFTCFQLEVVDESDKQRKVLELPPRSAKVLFNAVRQGTSMFEIESLGNRYLYVRIVPIPSESLCCRFWKWCKSMLDKVFGRMEPS